MAYERSSNDSIEQPQELLPNKIGIAKETKLFSIQSISPCVHDDQQTYPDLALNQNKPASSLTCETNCLQMKSNHSNSSIQNPCSDTHSLPSDSYSVELYTEEQFLHNLCFIPNNPMQEKVPRHAYPTYMLCENEKLATESKKNKISEIKDRPSEISYESEELVLRLKNEADNSKLVSQHCQQLQRRRRRQSRQGSSDCEIQLKTDTNTQLTEIKANGASQDKKISLIETRLNPFGRQHGYSSTESIVVSSSSGSLESLRSSNSEENRSSSSSESRHSNSLSSHSSDSNSCHVSGLSFNLRNRQQLCSYRHNSAKLQLLSPISDKSSQEPEGETLALNYPNFSEKHSPEEERIKFYVDNDVTTDLDIYNNDTIQKKKITPLDISIKEKFNIQSKNSTDATPQSSYNDTEIQGSDSGISIESKKEITRGPLNCSRIESPQQLKNPIKNFNQSLDIDNDLSDLPFDMPKLRRRTCLAQSDTRISGSATSVDITDLPFDMPKLRRRLKCSEHSLLNPLHTSNKSRISDDSSVILGKFKCYFLIK